jgi:hypothetical protein
MSAATLEDHSASSFYLQGFTEAAKFAVMKDDHK